MLSLNQKNRLAALLKKLGGNGDNLVIDSILKELTKIKASIPLPANLSPLTTDLKSLQASHANLAGTIASLVSQLTELKNQPKDYSTQKALTAFSAQAQQDLDTLSEEVDRLRRRPQGGSMNRKITIGGTDPLTRYTDINFATGTFTTANDNTNKRVNFTLNGSAFDSSYIRLDGTTTTSAIIPFTKGWSITGDTIPGNSITLTPSRSSINGAPATIYPTLDFVSTALSTFRMVEAGGTEFDMVYYDDVGHACNSINLNLNGENEYSSGSGTSTDARHVFYLNQVPYAIFDMTGFMGLGDGAFWGSVLPAATLHIADGDAEIRIGQTLTAYSRFVALGNGALTLAGVGSSAGFTFASPIIMAADFTISGFNLITDTTTGTKIGTATNQKLGFFNATPIVQVVATTDLGKVLSDLGLRAAGTAYPITTSGAVSFTGGLTVNTVGFSTNQQITSSLATGTAPFSIASTTKVTNLNVDQVDGFDLNQALLTSSTPTFSTLSLSASTNQIILDSTGFTTTLTDSATANRVITFPNLTTTLGGLAVAQTWTAGNTFNERVAIGATTDSLGNLLYLQKGYNMGAGNFYALSSQVYVNSVSTSGGILAAGYFENQTAGSGNHTGPVVGIYGFAYNDLQATGTISELDGLNYQVYNTGNSVVTLGQGVVAGIRVGAGSGNGTITTGKVYVSNLTFGGTGGMTTASHFIVNAPTGTVGAGGWTTQNGFWAPDMDAASTKATNNYEFWADGAAAIFFRASTQFINSSAASTLDLNTNTTMNLKVGANTELAITASNLAARGKFGTYNNILTEGYGVATIVDDVAITGRTTAITTTNFTNAQVAGTYRISYSLQDTTADATAGTLTLTIAYTDGGGAATKTATQVLTATGRVDGVIYLQEASGNLTYAVAITGGLGIAAAAYALFMTCERLS